MFVPLLLSAFCVAVASGTTTSLFQYKLVDTSSNDNYPEGSVEYHCFDIDAGVKTYVRGTYGNFGYFEGAVDDNDANVFHVNWFETAAESLAPTSGAATLTYNDNFLTTSGPYWSTGTSDISGSYGLWNSTDGEFVHDDSSNTGKQAILAKCLYPGATNAAARSDISALDGTIAVSGSSGQGENTLCEMPAGPEGGSWLGTYTYQYTADEGGSTENGHYGTNPFAFWGESGMGFVGTWHALSGDYDGDQGSNIYMVVGTDDATYIVGFYCSVDDDGIKTDCFNEYYEVDHKNENANDCPNYYRLDNSLDPLYEFAATGSTLSDSNDSSNNQLAVAMAILFGCLSGVLMAVLAFVLLSRGAGSKVSSAPSPA